MPEGASLPFQSMRHTTSLPARRVDLPAERTTITLPADLNRRVRAKARLEGRSISSILREALQAYLDGQEPPGLPSFTGIAASGRGDLSERVEELLAERFNQERPR
jgi:predicted transcriptional regulator